MSNIKLLSCPFCGSNKIRSALNQPEAFIECSLCDCAMERYGGKDLAAIWNTRIDRWIPVSEGLPKLVNDDGYEYSKKVQIVYKKMIIEASFSKHHNQWFADYEGTTIVIDADAVTHWLPITLPKGD